MFDSDECLYSKRDLLRLFAIRSTTSVYNLIRDGLLPRPVRLGRASRWPRSEIQAIVAARVAGLSDDDVRRLVDRLHAKRKKLAETMEAA